MLRAPNLLRVSRCSHPSQKNPRRFPVILLNDCERFCTPSTTSSTIPTVFELQAPNPVRFFLFSVARAEILDYFSKLLTSERKIFDDSDARPIPHVVELRAPNPCRFRQVDSARRRKLFIFCSFCPGAQSPTLQDDSVRFERRA